MIHALGVRRVLIDSLSHFERITSDPQELRELVFAFVNALKRLELTSLLTRESVALLGESPDIEEDLAYLVDSYVLLRYVELDSSLQKALLVLKQRGSAHAQDIRQFEIASNGLIVRSRFEGRDGILSGNPQRMAGAFVEAFVRR
jgi:circadian clock protein KaiC